MIKEIEILLVNLNNRYFGCNLDEIKKVITNVSNITDTSHIRGTERKNFYKLGDLFDIRENIDYSSLLVIDDDSHLHVLVAIPAIADIIKLITTKILIVPEYIRRKQDPFVVWGFIDNQGELTTLITFTHFKSIKMKDG